MATLSVLAATAAWVWAIRTRPDRPLHPVAVVALVLLTLLLVAVLLVAAAAGVMLAALLSIPAAVVLPEAGQFDTGQAAIGMVLDPVTVSVAAGIAAAGALTLRLGRRRSQD